MQDETQVLVENIVSLIENDGGFTTENKTVVGDMIEEFFEEEKYRLYKTLEEHLDAIPYNVFDIED